MIDSEVQRAVDVLQAAFGEDDPFTDVLVGGDRSLVPFNLESAIRDALIGGEVHVAALGPEVDSIIGVAVWYGPGQSAGATERQRAVQQEVFFSKCNEELRKWWLGNFLSSTGRLADETLGPKFHEAQWSLLLFGVFPEHQRKGVAKAMMNVAEERAKLDGVSIVLETTTDLDLVIYKKMGFEVKGQTTIMSPLGQYPMYQMLKSVNNL
ncbi:hypothetical protein H0H92_006223 [Tricholoma furcatifolium]|nr:hypothetical protein H0H92_006223 [Tricholoma furcatifolium]